jgi:hypothetical protein
MVAWAKLSTRHVQRWFYLPLAVDALPEECPHHGKIQHVLNNLDALYLDEPPSKLAGVQWLMRFPLQGCVVKEKSRDSTIGMADCE